MTDKDQRRERARQDAQDRAEQERRKEREREAMRRMGAPPWAVALRMEQLEAK